MNGLLPSTEKSTALVYAVYPVVAGDLRPEPNVQGWSTQFAKLVSKLVSKLRYMNIAHGRTSEGLN